jgi:PAS domain S-box-containing protein
MLMLHRVPQPCSSGDLTAKDMTIAVGLRPVDVRQGTEREEARIAALRRYEILDTPAEAAFDRLAAHARDLFDTPIALVSLIDETRQWFKARVGVGLREVPREWAFCEHTIRGGPGELLVVPDLSADPRFALNPLVSGEPHLRFYAGAPLVASDGLVLGTISVLSTEPRPAGLLPLQERGLVTLAAMAMDELELRLQARLAREAAEHAQAARAAEERLRRAQEAAGVVAFECRGRGTAIEMPTPPSAGLHGMLGLPDGASLTPRRILSAVHPEDRPALLAAARELAAGGGDFRCEFRALRSGSVADRWLQARGELDGTFTANASLGWRLSGVLLDVTERKETEIALREAELRQRTLFGTAPFGVIVIDPVTHRILDVNDRACEEYGYTREEFLAMSIADIDALGDSEAIRLRGRAHVVRPGTQELEVQHRTKSGEIRDVLLRAQGVVLGGRDVTYGAHFDITARKAAEARLARLAAILEATPDLVAIVEARTGVAAYLNAAFRSFLELPPDADAGTVRIESWQDAKAIALLVGTALPEARQSGSWMGENTVRSQDGRSVPVSQVVLAHRGVDGEVEHYSTIMRDLTEQKRAEEERLLLVRELDHRAKNILAVVQAALRLTPKTDSDTYASAVEGRVMALARAHSMLSERRWSGADLRMMLENELTAFLTAPGTTGDAAVQDMPRAVLDGPSVTLLPAVAQGLSMALHELATNATKHGALSAPGGRLSVSWAAPSGVLQLCWRETGGPPVNAAPTRRGFGTRVLDSTIRGQLGGAVRLTWSQQVWCAMSMCHFAAPAPCLMAASLRHRPQHPRPWRPEASPSSTASLIRSALPSLSGVMARRR